MVVFCVIFAVKSQELLTSDYFLTKKMLVFFQVESVSLQVFCHVRKSKHS